MTASVELLPELNANVLIVVNCYRKNITVHLRRLIIYNKNERENDVGWT